MELIAYDDPAIAEGAWKDSGKAIEDMRCGDPHLLVQIAVAALREARGAQTILEAGCGGGLYGEVIVYYGIPLRYTGLDFNIHVLNRVRPRNTSKRVCVGNAGNLPFPNQSYDIVLSSAVICHNENWEQLTTEVCRVARQYALFHRTWLWRERDGILEEPFMGDHGLRLYRIAIGYGLFLNLVQAQGFRLRRAWRIPARTDILSHALLYERT